MRIQPTSIGSALAGRQRSLKAIGKPANRRTSPQDWTLAIRRHLADQREPITAAAATNGWNSPRQKKYIETVCLNFIHAAQRSKQQRFENPTRQLDSIPRPALSQHSMWLDLHGTPPIRANVCERIWDGLSEQDTAIELGLSLLTVQRVLRRAVEFLFKAEELRSKKAWTFEEGFLYPILRCCWRDSIWQPAAVHRVWCGLDQSRKQLPKLQSTSATIPRQCSSTAGSAEHLPHQQRSNRKRAWQPLQSGLDGSGI